MSRGIRIYIGSKRAAYRFVDGMRVLEELLRHLHVKGVGCESGAMTVHLG